MRKISNWSFSRILAPPPAPFPRSGPGYHIYHQDTQMRRKGCRVDITFEKYEKAILLSTWSGSPLRHVTFSGRFCIFLRNPFLNGGEGESNGVDSAKSAALFDKPSPILLKFVLVILDPTQNTCWSLWSHLCRTQFYLINLGGPFGTRTSKVEGTYSDCIRRRNFGNVLLKHVTAIQTLHSWCLPFNLRLSLYTRHKNGYQSSRGILLNQY